MYTANIGYVPYMHSPYIGLNIGDLALYLAYTGNIGDLGLYSLYTPILAPTAVHRLNRPKYRGI